MLIIHIIIIIIIIIIINTILMSTILLLLLLLLLLSFLLHWPAHGGVVQMAPRQAQGRCVRRHLARIYIYI